MVQPLKAATKFSAAHKRAKMKSHMKVHPMKDDMDGLDGDPISHTDINLINRELVELDLPQNND